MGIINGINIMYRGDLMKESYDIKGMSCSSCASLIEHTIKKLKGVNGVNVNLLNNEMFVDYDEKVLSSFKIEQEVKNIGYFAKSRSLKNDEKNNYIEKENFQKDQIKQMKKRVILSFIFLIILMYVSMGDMIGIFRCEFLLGHKNALSFAFTQFILTLPIMYINRNYYITGFKALSKKNTNMDTLVALGSLASVVFGIYVIYRLSYALSINSEDILKKYYHSIYFESSGMILTLITFGKYLESISKQKTKESVKKLMDLSPKKAIVIRNNKEIEIDANDIEKGDILVLKSGTMAAADGKIIEGFGLFDTSSITGESIPNEKTIGDIVLTSSILKDGYVKMIAQKVKNETILSKIIKLVENANATKPKIAKLVDKIAYIFVPSIILISIITFLIWVYVEKSVDFAFEMAISVLVISCPCALGLATPVAIMVATGKAARVGLLIKSSESLEMLDKVDIVVFDKTGTLTEGKPVVTDIISNNLKKQDLLEILYSLEKNSQHPLAISICEYAKEEKIKPKEVYNFTNKIGFGISGLIDDKKYFLGNFKYITEKIKLTKEFYNYFEKFSSEGKTVIFLKDEKQLLALIAISDKVKQTSKEAIKILKSMNINTIMLTGDNKKVAKEIKEKLNIDEFFAELLPEDKVKIIKDLISKNKKVIMVGDGINDSPALSVANVGICVQSGTDIAMEASDVILMKNDMMDIVNLINLSKKTIKNIKENLFWAFFYNIICIPLAAGIFYIPFKMHLSPMIASFCMSCSSVFVVLNALRLNNFKKINSLETVQNNLKNINKEFKKINTLEVDKGGFKMKKVVIVDGMVCGHCKKRIEDAFNELQGVKATVDLEKKTLTLESKNEISDETIKDLLEKLNYDFVKFL